MGFHSCEESPVNEQYLLPAFETGIGAMVSINGGWVVASDDLVLVQRVALPDTKVLMFVITSYSIHYTKLYDFGAWRCDPDPGGIRTPDPG